MSNRLGPISLSVCAVGFTTCEILIHQGILAGRWWSVLADGFEAGTIGGMADWFAVSALFREVPIPWLRRHTNIIIKHRERFTRALQDYVQHALLTPAVIKEQLSQVPFTRGILDILVQDDHRPKLISLAGDLLTHLMRGLDQVRLVAAIEVHARSALAGVQLAKPLADWIEGTLDRREHVRVWEVALSRGRIVLEDAQTRTEIAGILKEAIRDYAKSGLAAKILVWISDALSSTDYERCADAIVGRAGSWITAVTNDPDHPFRLRTEQIIRQFAEEMRCGEPHAMRAIDDLRRALLTNVDLQALIGQALEGLLTRLTNALADPASATSAAVARLLDQALHSLQENQQLQQQCDAHLRATIAQFIEENHHLVGTMVATSLSPSRLADRALVDQIEDKVGDDLQYIRLNGAVVGGLVGVLLGLITVFCDR